MKLLKRIFGQSHQRESEAEHLKLDSELKQSARRREEANRRLTAVEATIPIKRRGGHHRAT